MRVVYLLVLLLLGSAVEAQVAKRSLTHADYDHWKTVQRSQLSQKGNWVSYEINPQEGDGVLVVESPRQNRKYRIERGHSAQFSPDEAYLIARIKPKHEDNRQAKKKKLKADLMPKDSLLVLRLDNDQRRYYRHIKSFALPKEAGNWLAVLVDAKALTAADTTKKAAKAPKGKKAPKGDRLTLMQLDGTGATHFDFVSEYRMAERGGAVVLAREALHDSSQVRGVFAFRTGNKSLVQLDTSSRFKQYKNLAVNKAGDQAAWMASADSANAEVKKFALYFRRLQDATALLVADTTTKAYPAGWSVSEYREPRFSDDGRRLYFGTAPLALASLKDTTRLDEELSRVDVWSWTDPKLQPMQAKQKKQESERSFVAFYDITSRKMVQAGSAEVPTVEVDYRNNHPYLLGTSNLSYQRISSWDLGHTDFYLINTNTGTTTLIAQDVVGQAELSPAGKYVTWFSERDTVWKAYDIKSQKTIELTRGLPVAFQDEEHDSPSFASAYGAAGWTRDDRYFWVYDRYDIWQLDPTQKEKPKVITGDYGRKERVKLRYVHLNEENPTIPADQELLLAGIWEKDKQTGLLNFKANTAPALIVKEAFYYQPSSISKAKEEKVYLFQKGNYNQANELYYVGKDWKQPQKLTGLTAQMDSIRWGNVELVSWLSAQGTRLEGLLFKPEGFDPGKKYPMLVYYYERNAETLHMPRNPSPSRSTINIPYCVSNGYLVFVPDIVYSGGTPGKNAYDCIVTGVLDLINRGYVDRERVGIQGQSWGGYQTAYLITQTNMFKAAMAGAPVANMTSAYGGIRWGTGMSRMFQYEQTQSRIGGTLWEKPMYYLENSPLFYADRIQTPLLMMHNDADGAVPWYQGIEFFSALRRLNKPVWMLVYNEEDHNLTKRPNMKDLSIRMYQFFDYYLKDAPQPAWMKQGRTVLDKERWDMKYE
ncbi:prolyl oligopeptidase family serine peptidase [Telluribacter sp. SYSU D00476]|uniref:S9 family peptidase n=1 Tax=Telluribacter sp. SYSU D00476 TaxID=2811430 RepID=UPI001FF380D2|nr:prolyl oligopeptidase family serine peptidase [Telluribacter sp. SYSU D00476]